MPSLHLAGARGKDGVCQANVNKHVAGSELGAFSSNPLHLLVLLHCRPARLTAPPSVWRCCHVDRRRRRQHVNSSVLKCAQRFLALT
jgi:hypothetical protein